MLIELNYAELNAAKGNKKKSKTNKSKHVDCQSKKMKRYLVLWIIKNIYTYIYCNSAYCLYTLLHEAKNCGGEGAAGVFKGADSGGGREPWPPPGTDIFTLKER